jgi:hypothetical protein
MRLRILWLARTLPFPAVSGDRAYVTGYLKALAPLADITYMGIGNSDAQALADTALPLIRWKPVDCPLQPAPLSLMRSRPYVSARHSPRALVNAVRGELATRHYDWLVLDQYALGWVLEDLGAAVRAAGSHVLYFSHNHETALAADTTRDFTGSRAKRLLLARNARLIAAMERNLVQRADLVSAISEDDAHALSALSARRRPIVLVPGIDLAMPKAQRSQKTASRRLVVVGSFHWVPKQINLTRFFADADAVARARHAAVDIIGEVPDGLRHKLSTQYPWVRFLGFVVDLDATLAHYPMALNFEQTGGGFKLKNLTYIAAGVPIAALETSLTGVPQALAETMLVRRTAGELMAAALDALQTPQDLALRAGRALDLVRQIYSWDRGAHLLLDHMRETHRATGRQATSSAPLLARSG